MSKSKFLFKMNLKERKRHQKIKKKYQQEKRKIRKKKLIQLGTLFAICNLLEEKQETILGFLQDYQNKEEYTKLGEQILKNKPVYSLPDDFLERKKYFYKIIRKSALLEKLKLHLENPNTILGYLSKYKFLTKDNIDSYTLTGQQIFKKNYLTDLEKIEVLRLFMNNNLDFRKYLKEKYNTNIENLNYIIYLQIKKELG
ncbi:hypothetical protein [Fusobacterium sp. SYSU M8D902]|uniref:hypothetical protein n=1 Tax=Fusobacterium sp. SYSU M8D902 TaxID=3159562 RepID=UPI0032E5280D